MLDLTNYAFLDSVKFAEDVFDYFKDNSEHYGLQPNQIVGNKNENPNGGLVIDIYWTDYTPLQGEMPTTNFLDKTTITIMLQLQGVAKATASKSYAELCNRTARLSAVASNIENYLWKKGYDVSVSSVMPFQAYKDVMKASDTLNNIAVINLTTTIFRNIN